MEHNAAKVAWHKFLCGKPSFVAKIIEHLEPQGSRLECLPATRKVQQTQVLRFEISHSTKFTNGAHAIWWRPTWCCFRHINFPLICEIKALVNEDTLLRTHYCLWCFLGCPNWETFVADTKCFWTTSETFFFCVLDAKFVPATNVARGQTGKHLCQQQCVRNNVSSFAMAFKSV